MIYHLKWPPPKPGSCCWWFFRFSLFGCQVRNVLRMLSGCCTWPYRCSTPSAHTSVTGDRYEPTWNEDKMYDTSWRTEDTFRRRFFWLRSTMLKWKGCLVVNSNHRQQPSDRQRNATTVPSHGEEIQSGNVTNVIRRGDFLWSQLANWYLGGWIMDCYFQLCTKSVIFIGFNSWIAKSVFLIDFLSVMTCHGL